MSYPRPHSCPRPRTGSAASPTPSPSQLPSSRVTPFPPEHRRQGRSDQNAAALALLELRQLQFHDLILLSCMASWALLIFLTGKSEIPNCTRISQRTHMFDECTDGEVLLARRGSTHPLLLPFQLLLEVFRHSSTAFAVEVIDRARLLHEEVGLVIEGLPEDRRLFLTSRANVQKGLGVNDQVGALEDRRDVGVVRFLRIPCGMMQPRASS